MRTKPNPKPENDDERRKRLYAIPLRFGPRVRNAKIRQLRLHVVDGDKLRPAWREKETTSKPAAEVR